MILRRRLCLSSRVNSKGRRETTLFLFEKIMHQSIPPAPSPLPRATAGHLPALSVPGVGHLQILHCPGTGHLPTPGAFPSFLQERGFLSGYNYTEGFPGKKRKQIGSSVEDRNKLKRVIKACSRFYARISLLLIKVARYSFSGPIPPKFEHKLRRHKQSFGKIATTVVLDKDENLL